MKTWIMKYKQSKVLRKMDPSEIWLTLCGHVRPWKKAICISKPTKYISVTGKMLQELITC